MKIPILRSETDVRPFDAGTIIFDEGDPAGVMYAVVEGSVAIEVDGRVVETAGPGAIFGEMALVDHEPRSARAVAVTPCKLSCIDERRFMFLVQETPLFALQVMRVFAERLRRSSAVARDASGGQPRATRS
jgi:CRP/FNR family cyclic AMP-dependent transcriptional regulator